MNKMPEGLHKQPPDGNQTHHYEYAIWWVTLWRHQFQYKSELPRAVIKLQWLNPNEEENPTSEQYQIGCAFMQKDREAIQQQCNTFGVCLNPMRSIAPWRRFIDGCRFQKNPMREKRLGSDKRLTSSPKKTIDGNPLKREISRA